MKINTILLMVEILSNPPKQTFFKMNQRSKNPSQKWELHQVEEAKTKIW